MNQTNPFLVAHEPEPPSFAFAPEHESASPLEPAIDADSYTMIRSAPAPAPEEVELPDVSAVEVFVCWGNSVLHVAHLNPPRPFYVGETRNAAEPCDCLLPSERLGTARLPLLLGSAQALSLVIPNGATGYVQVPGQALCALEAAYGEGEPLVEVPGARAVPFRTGMRVRIEHAGYVFRLASVRAGRPTERGLFATDWSTTPYFGLSLALHAGLIGVLAFLSPSLGLADEEDLDRNRLYVMQQFLDSAAERERKDNPDAAQGVQEQEGGKGERAAGAEGAMGNPTVQARSKRYAIRGPKENPDVHISRLAAIKEAADFGMIGLLHTMAGSANAPTAPWGRDTALGSDEVDARGNMWGDEIGEAYGAAGLGLTGIGEGSGGHGRGIGLGLDGIGHGAGLANGDGFGHGTGRLRGTYAPKARVGLRPGVTTVSGRLPPEVVQRIVRQNFGRFRNCYSQGLTRNPALEGRVSARFVIARDGSVSSVSNGGSDLPDSGVTSCVLSAFYGLSFPQPEGGIVTVVYPIMLSPG
jgi:hypothetical protein